MDKKTKNLFKAITGFAALTMTIGLVATLSVGEKEKVYICETDRLLDNYTLQTSPNEYPNGVTVAQVDYPSYSTGLEYSVDTRSGEGTKGNPYKASVSRGDCTLTDVVLPEFYQVGNTYYKVVAIDQDGFNAKKPRKDEDGSVIGCYNLTSISSLKEFELVGSQAFAYTSLQTVEFSKNLKELSPSTFFHCKSLETTNFVKLDPNETTVTGTFAAISSVGDNCFTDCINYTGMILPRTLTNIGNGAYQNCTSLTSVFLPATDVVGQHLEVGDYAFAGCSKVTIIYISSKVEKIGAFAFEGCVNAKGYSALSFEALKTKIGKDGDGDWNYLFNEGTYDSEGAYDRFLEFGEGRDGRGDLLYDQPYFYSLNQDGTCTLDVFDGSTSNNPADVDLYNIDRVIPETRGDAGYPVSRIGQELFLNDTTMKTLTLPDSVRSIGIAAFAGCTSLDTVALNSGLELIDDYAFAPWNGVGAEEKGNNLTELEIPSTVIEIGDYAFPYMYDMMNIRFLGSEEDESNLKYIGEYAFYKAGWSYKDTCYQNGSFTEVRNPLILNMHPILSSGYQGATQANEGRPLSSRETYTEIGKFAFFGNQWIGSIRITSDHLVTNGFVFANCFWLIEADLGEGLVILGNGKNAGDGDGKPARDYRGRLFSVSVDESNVNIAQPQKNNNLPTDLGGPLENNSDALKKPLVPMSSFYLPALGNGQSTGQGTLDGRYHTMIYTKGPSNWFFQWKGGYEGYCDLQPTYLDMGSVSTASEAIHTKGNDALSGDYYGVDTAVGSAYIEGDGKGYYQIKQGGYFEITYGHASVTENNGTYSATYRDENGAVISSINSGKRYGFTYYDPDTGRAKFDFIQKSKNSYELILSKFHYNPYWEQSKNVVVPQNVTFGGRTFTVTEIGNCAFFRNICPQSHAWYSNGTGAGSSRVYVSPQDPNEKTKNPQTDSKGLYYAENNDDYYNLESVTLPNTIKRIGGNAFYMCAGLSSIKTSGYATEGKLPTTLQKIGQYAFSFSAITAIDLPSSVTVLGNGNGLCNPFANCLALTSITATSGTFKVSNGYLTNSSGDKIHMSPLGTTSTSIVIPDGIKTLGNMAFRGARKITSIEIPASLETIEANCFEDIRYGETNMGSNGDGNKKRGDNTDKGVYARKQGALTTMTVTGGAVSKLKTIGNSAFNECDVFHGIDFPNQLETIGDFAFKNCKVANNYYIPNTLTSIGTQAFRENKQLQVIRTDKKPSGEASGYLNLADTQLMNIGANAFQADTKITKLALPSTLKYLNNGPIFASGFDSLTTVYIHDDTLEMNSGVFDTHKSLTTFKTWSGTVDANGDVQNLSPNNALPSNLRAFGTACFQSCEALESFSSFPATLQTIGTNCFKGCKNANFTTADFSNSTANLTIYGNAFDGCTNLSSLTFVSAPGSRDKAGGTLEIVQDAFNNCTSLNTYVILPRGTTAKKAAFKYTNLTAIYACDVYDDAKSLLSGNITSNTSATLYYYAAGPEDKGTATSQTKFWHYVGNVPTPWTPA